MAPLFPHILNATPPERRKSLALDNLFILAGGIALGLVIGLVVIAYFLRGVP